MYSSLLYASCTVTIVFRFLCVFHFDLDGHAKCFFDFHLIGFHKGKFWAKEKGTELSAPFHLENILHGYALNFANLLIAFKKYKNLKTSRK